MRIIVALGRGCARSCSSRPLPPLTRNSPIASLRHNIRYTRFYSLRSTPPTKQWRWYFRLPPTPKGGRAKTLLLASLSPAAFVALGEEHDHDDAVTGEASMLAASRAELADYVPPYLQAHRIQRIVWRFVDTWIWEPLATGVRFLHLVLIFVPVIVTVPVIWCGRRVPERDNERSGTLWWYGFLVASMERAGAAFIKLGQWAASRSDIFPTELCAVMSALHSNAPAHSLAATKRTIVKAFEGRRFEEIFEEFDEKPLGVGAIAQVYKAKLKADLVMPQDNADVEQQGLAQRVRKNVDVVLKATPDQVPSSYVAIKVLHPKIERIVRRDLRIMGFGASLLNILPGVEWLSLPDEVAEFGEMMKLQLDLRIEAANLTIFRKHFRDRTTACFPFPYTAYTTRQLLIEEFAHGIPLESFIRNGGGSFQHDIAQEGLDAFLHMLLIDNFVHADLHPGNIMVRFHKAKRSEVGKKITAVRSQYSPLDGAPSINGNDDDVTEDVLRRLRPLKEDKKAWRAELNRIDAEGYRPQLIFIDTGLVTELNATNRANFLALFQAVAEFDGYRAGKLMVERCRQPDAVRDPDVFALRMQHLVLGVKSRTFALGNIRIGDVLHEVLDMVRGHHVRLEGDFVNVVLSILLLEGIGRSLDPNTDLFAGALPILRQLGTARGSGRALMAGGKPDLAMLKIWAGLEARSFLQASVESVEICVKYDLLSPNI